MKKTDIILIVLVIAFSVLLSLLLRKDFTGELRVNILVDGELVRSEVMTGNGSQIVIENQFGCNIIEIESDAVSVIWSDCASQVCVHTAKISKAGEIIVCLPHRLMISIEGLRKPEDIDAIA